MSQWRQSVFLSVVAGVVLLAGGTQTDAAPTSIPNWVEHLAIQVTVAPLDNVKLRQAIASAIDRAAVTRAAAGSLPPNLAMIGPAGSWFVPGLPQHRDDLQVIPYNPGRARELLTEAGFSGSQPPALEIFYRTDFPQRRAAAAIIQAQLTAVGIPVKAVGLSSQEFGRRVLQLRPGGRGGDFSLAIMAWGNPTSDSDFFTMFLQGDQRNVYGYRNTDVTIFLTDALKEQDHAKRIGLLQKAESAMLNDAPVVPLYYYR